MTMTRTRKRVSVLVAVAFGAAACGMLDVTNPGPIADDNLNALTAASGLVVGMSYDLSRSMDNVTQESAIMADELFHGGSYANEKLFNQGVIRPDLVNGLWNAMHRARWVAEAGITRLKAVLTDFDSNPLAARANLYAGFANRILGEHVCTAVIDGGGSQPYTLHFSRAEAQFDEAIRIANAVTNVGLKDSLLRAAWMGRASVRAWQNNWAGADADAVLALTPTAGTPRSTQALANAYRFVAFFSTNTAGENNDLVAETTPPYRVEYTVWNTRWAQVFGDPRVPWDTLKTSSGAIQKGQDGNTNHFRQRKYLDLAADIPLAKGAEMWVLRAEAALRNNDLPSAITYLNNGRSAYGIAAIAAPPATVAAAWPVLQQERGATTWLEARRLWDLRRWHAEAAPIHTTWFETVPIPRDQCIPISETEMQSNPTLRGT